MNSNRRTQTSLKGQCQFNRSVTLTQRHTQRMRHYGHVLCAVDTLSLHTSLSTTLLYILFTFIAQHYTSYLIAMFTLMSYSLLTNPNVVCFPLYRLQERFVMPSSLGLPCPPPSFPGWQEFFRDFVVAASSHVFNQHLLNSLITKVSQVWFMSAYQVVGNYKKKDLSITFMR